MLSLGSASFEDALGCPASPPAPRSQAINKLELNRNANDRTDVITVADPLGDGDGTGQDGETTVAAGAESLFHMAAAEARLRAANTAGRPVLRSEERAHPTKLKIMRQLTNDDRGRYLLTTATGSRYILDLEARALSRTMAATSPREDHVVAGVSRLRRDGEPIELLMLEACEVGAMGRFWLQIRTDHVPTLRETSPIVRIEELAAAET